MEELGCTVFQQWEKGKSWRMGGTYLVFVQAEKAYIDAGYHRRRIGLNHLAFHASSPQKVDELKRKLEGKGVSILYKDHYPHAGGEEHYALYFEDPDRMKVELVAKNN